MTTTVPPTVSPQALHTILRGKRQWGPAGKSCVKWVTHFINTAVIKELDYYVLLQIKRHMFLECIMYILHITIRFLYLLFQTTLWFHITTNFICNSKKKQHIFHLVYECFHRTAALHGFMQWASNNMTQILLQTLHLIFSPTIAGRQSWSLQTNSSTAQFTWMKQRNKPTAGILNVEVYRVKNAQNSSQTKKLKSLSVWLLVSLHLYTKFMIGSSTYNKAAKLFHHKTS